MMGAAEKLELQTMVGRGDGTMHATQATISRLRQSYRRIYRDDEVRYKLL